MRALVGADLLGAIVVSFGQDVEELIANAGPDFSIDLPPKRRGGGFESGIVVRLA